MLLLRGVAGVLLVLSASCSSGASCPASEAPDPDCADLVFRGHSYDEWREIEPPGILQELGDANYPACNQDDECDGAGSGVGGFGATDVWLLEGVDPQQAVIGLREDTHTYVVFVEVGTDPESLRIPAQRLR